MASRSLDDLSEHMRRLTLDFLAACALEKIDVLIYCTMRSNAEQDALYAQGRTTPGHIVTNAKAGQSSHNPGKDGKARAFDAVPLMCGKPQWNDAATYLKMGEIAESVGLKWAGRWTGRLREVAHFSEDGK